MIDRYCSMTKCLAIANTLMLITETVTRLYCIKQPIIIIIRPILLLLLVVVVIVVKSCTIKYPVS